MCLRILLKIWNVHTLLFLMNLRNFQSIFIFFLILRFLFNCSWLFQSAGLQRLGRRLISRESLSEIWLRLILKLPIKFFKLLILWLVSYELLLKYLLLRSCWRSCYFHSFRGYSTPRLIHSMNFGFSLRSWKLINIFAQVDTFITFIRNLNFNRSKLLNLNALSALKREFIRFIR